MQGRLRKNSRRRDSPLKASRLSPREDLFSEEKAASEPWAASAWSKTDVGLRDSLFRLGRLTVHDKVGAFSTRPDKTRQRL
tara:strand:- start:12 stop:254 length:243 start_codon:yes stop_codon:yes gene_type:complete